MSGGNAARAFAVVTLDTGLPHVLQPLVGTISALLTTTTQARQARTAPLVGTVCQEEEEAGGVALASLMEAMPTATSSE